MAPSRNPSKATPRANATPYETRARRTQDAGSSNDVSNEVSSKNQNTATTVNSSPVSATARRSRTKGAKEFCTDQQSAALEAFFWLHKGYPDAAQILEISARIGKSVPSVKVWLQNHRNPRRTENTPWFRVPGAIDPEIDPSASYYPKNPTRRPFEKKPDVLVDVPDVRTDQPARQVASTNLQIDHLVTRESTTPKSSRWSGDSNGSEASSPRSSPPASVTNNQPPTSMELCIAETLLELKIHPRLSVPASGINPPYIKQSDQGYAGQQPSSGPIRTNHSSAIHLRKEDHVLAWRVANPYGRLPPGAKKGSRATKTARFADIDDEELEARSPSMLVSHERPVSATEQSINRVPGMALCSAIEGPPPQALNAPKITQIPLPCNCLPVAPLSLIATSQGMQVPHIIPCALDFAPAPYRERANATPSYGDLASAPYVLFPAARYQGSSSRQSLTPEEGDTTGEEDMEAIAPLCSIAGGIHGECRLSRNVASPARR